MAFNPDEERDAAEDELAKELGRKPTKEEVETRMIASYNAGKDADGRKRSGLKIDVHILLDAYFHLNEGLTYDPDMDITICEIAEEWKYKCDDKDGKLVLFVNPHNEEVSNG